jgi:hypothetical protein
MEEPKVADKSEQVKTGGDSQSGTTEKLVAEVTESIKAFTQKVVDELKTVTGDGVTDESKHVGTLTLVDEKIVAKVEKPQDNKDAADKDAVTEAVLKPLSKPEQLGDDAKSDLARKFESLAKDTLERLHHSMTFTTDGSPPTVIKYNPSGAALGADTSAEDIAKQQLGNKATPEQVQAYTNAVVNLNLDESSYNEAEGKEYFKAGTSLKLPGQTADGGIVYADKDDDGRPKMVKTWQDGSRQESYSDGSGTARYTEGTKVVTVHWDGKNPNENYEKRNEYVVTNATTGAGYTDSTIRSADSQGRTVELTKRDANITSIKITDKHSNITELTPGADGEFHGKTTNRGKEVDTDVWADKSGRVYEKATDASGKTTKTYEDGSQYLYDKKGRLVEKTYKDEKERTLHEIYKPGKSNADRVTLTEKDGSVLEVRQGKDGLWHGTKKDSTGKVIDEHAGLSGDGRTFSETKNADGMVRTYEDGLVQKHDAKGHLTYEEGKDNQGRKFEATYNPGENTPHKYNLAVETGKPPVEFNRQANGQYLGDQLDAAGNKVGKVEMGGGGAVVFSDMDGKNPRVVFPDGRTIKQNDLADGSKQFIETKNGEVHTQKLDPQGRKVSESFVAGGRTMTITTDYAGDKKTAAHILIVDQTGVSKLEENLVTDSFTGTRTSFTGKQEKVAFVDGKLIYRDAKTDQVTGAEELRREEGALVSKPIKMDYQMNAGTVSRPLGGGAELRETLSPGRTEFLNSNGTVSGFRMDGDVSYAGPRGSNEASVIHNRDLTGATLKADGSIEMWNKDAAHTEKISEQEKKFLDKNPQADRRDFVEIHRKLSPDQAKIDAFYKALEKVDSTDNLSSTEKISLKDNLIRHVAYPDEIYQGRSPTCNVAVLQREMAIDNPAKYVEFVAGAVEGEATTKSGDKVHFNVDNLKMADSSGRDLASRVFQTAAVNMTLYPGKAFLNTESGVGEVRSIAEEDKAWFSDKRSFEYKDDAKTFEGLNIMKIAEIATKLNGDNYSPVLVKSPEDMVAVYKANGGRPTTIAVNGSEYPFKKVGPVGSGSGTNHVVTITGVDNGPPLKFYVQNQWGLSQDRSKETTAIDGDDLFRNMRNTGSDSAVMLPRVRGGDPRSIKMASVDTTGGVTYDHLCTVRTVGGKEKCE